MLQPDSNVSVTEGNAGEDEGHSSVVDPSNQDDEGEDDDEDEDGNEDEDGDGTPGSHHPGGAPPPAKRMRRGEHRDRGGSGSGSGIGGDDSYGPPEGGNASLPGLLVGGGAAGGTQQPQPVKLERSSAEAAEAATAEAAAAPISADASSSEATGELVFMGVDPSGAGGGSATHHAALTTSSSSLLPTGMMAPHEVLLNRLVMNQHQQQQLQQQQQSLSQYPSSFSSPTVGAPPVNYFAHHQPNAGVGGGGGGGPSVMSFLDPRFLSMGGMNMGTGAVPAGGPLPNAFHLYRSSQQQQQQQQQQEPQLHAQGHGHSHLYSHHPRLFPSAAGAVPSGGSFPYGAAHSHHLSYPGYWAGASPNPTALAPTTVNGLFPTPHAALMLQQQQQLQLDHPQPNATASAAAGTRGYPFQLQGLEPSAIPAVASSSPAQRRAAHGARAGDTAGAGGDNAHDAATPQRVLPMSYPTDDDAISKYQCLLRRQIEFFEATSVDLKARAQGRNVPIRLRQIGIRCRHCASSGIPPGYRPRGSVYFPVKLASLYQSAQNMANNHWNTNACSSIPEPIVAELNKLKRCKSSGAGTGGQRHWVRTAQAIGIVDSPESGLSYVGGVKAEQDG